MRNLPAKLQVYVVFSLSLPVACDVDDLDPAFDDNTTVTTPTNTDTRDSSTADSEDETIKPLCMGGLVWQCSIPTAYPQYSEQIDRCSDPGKYPDVCSQQLCAAEVWAMVQQEHQKTCLMLACPDSDTQRVVSCEMEYQEQMLKCMRGTSCTSWENCHMSDVLHHASFLRQCVDGSS